MLLISRDPLNALVKYTGHGQYAEAPSCMGRWQSTGSVAHAQFLREEFKVLLSTSGERTLT